MDGGGDRHRRVAAVLAVGTELTAGLRQDTNGREAALALTGCGHRVTEFVLAPDDEDEVAEILSRLAVTCDVVVVTGGLGPTHDDITREAASRAFGLPLRSDPALEAGLAAVLARHSGGEAYRHVLKQALVLEGARVIPATRGTAAGQVVQTSRALVALLPGPPREMRPMLEEFVAMLPGTACAAVSLRCTGLMETDAQLAAEKVLEGREGISLGLLSRPGEVEVLLFDEGAGAEGLREAGKALSDSLGEACFSTEGECLAEVVLRLARRKGLKLAAAESCTGGMIAAALTDVPGSSDVFMGGAVSYSNESKTELLGVPEAEIARCGAVSEEVAADMARGAVERFEADIAVSTTGIAGPGGGSGEKPVGTVWFGLAVRTGASTEAEMRILPGDRAAVRQRATAIALDLLRRRML